MRDGNGHYTEADQTEANRADTLIIQAVGFCVSKENEMKDTFIVYTSYLDKFAKLSDEQLGRLFRIMLEYQTTGDVPKIDDMALSFCFDVVKYDMDENNRKYDEMCERQRNNVLKRWNKSNTDDTTVYHGIPPYTTDTKHTDNEYDNDSVSDNEHDSVSVNDNVVLTDKVKKEDTIVSKKETRHKYGQYNNVLLSDTDMEKLKAEFPTDWERRIERLSEYIESKGAKYKNHLATIRAWARKDQDKKQSKANERPYAFRVIDEMDFGEGSFV